MINIITTETVRRRSALLTDQTEYFAGKVCPGTDKDCNSDLAEFYLKSSNKQPDGATRLLSEL